MSARRITAALLCAAIVTVSLPAFVFDMQSVPQTRASLPPFPAKQRG